jgi:Uri superfamily endonuclease
MAGDLGKALLAHVRACLPPSAVIRAGCAEGASPAPGAYALLIELRRVVHVQIGRQNLSFAPGWYVYAGSARGPGGLRGRIGRHLRRDKTMHWHVDHLTAQAMIVAIAVEDGRECEIVAALLRSGTFRSSAAGFGSSDCPLCTAHLLEVRCEKSGSL